MNDEARMTKGVLGDRSVKGARMKRGYSWVSAFRVSCFVILSSFVIRASSFPAPHLGGDGEEDDRSLDGAFPLRRDVQEDEGGGDGGEEEDAGEDSPEAAASAGNGDAADDGGGDGLHLEALAGFGIDVGEADGVQEGGQAGERAGEDEGGEGDRARAKAGEAGGVFI